MQKKTKKPHSVRCGLPLVPYLVSVKFTPGLFVVNMAIGQPGIVEWKWGVLLAKVFSLFTFLFFDKNT
jgi:hypothetical protein